MTDRGPARTSEPVLIFAHRGASKTYPEHTRAAYLEAIEQGADGLETDVRLTADRQLVCWHDATTDRTTGVAGYVHQRTLEELRALDVLRGATVPDAFGSADDQVLSLRQLLELMRSAPRALRLALEIKQPGPFGSAVEEAVFRELDDLGWDPATGALGSVTIDLMCFWPQTVEGLLDRLAPSLVMLLVEDASESDVAKWIEHETSGLLAGPAALDAAHSAAAIRQRLLETPGLGVGPDKKIVRTSPDLVRGWAATRRVRVWTVDSEADADLCIDVGVRELTTNRPGALRAALEEPTSA